MSRFKILGVRVSANERWPRWLCPSYCRWHFRCLKISRCRGWLESGSICRGWFSDFFWEIARPWNKLRVAPFVDTYFLSQQRVSRQCTVSLLKQAWLLVLNGWLRTGKVEHHFMVDILHHLQMGWWNLEIYPWRVANHESAKKNCNPPRRNTYVSNRMWSGLSNYFQLNLFVWDFDIALFRWTFPVYVKKQDGSWLLYQAFMTKYIPYRTICMVVKNFFSPKILASQKMASKKVVEDGEAKIHQSQICQISRCWNSPREIPGHRDGDGWKMGGGAVQKGDGCWYRILWV